MSDGHFKKNFEPALTCKSGAVAERAAGVLGGVETWILLHLHDGSNLLLGEVRVVEEDLHHLPHVARLQHLLLELVLWNAAVRQVLKPIGMTIKHPK